MYCSQCGKEIADNSKFCPECGENISGDSSNKSTLVDETRDTRKSFFLRNQYYTKEERKDPRNKKKRHIWHPYFWSSNYKNTQESYSSALMRIVLIILCVIYYFRACI